MEELESTTFLRWLARDVAGTLQDVVGIEEANGYLSLVADEMGQRIDSGYVDTHGDGRWTIDTVSEVLVDLKRRIGGTFAVTNMSDDRIELVNGRCPFGDAVLGRPALCMMTSNVFGRIAANHLGAASVELHETIAHGDGRCRVVVRSGADDTITGDGVRHYFATE